MAAGFRYSDFELARRFVSGIAHDLAHSIFVGREIACEFIFSIFAKTGCFVEILADFVIIGRGLVPKRLKDNEECKYHFEIL